MALDSGLSLQAIGFSGKKMAPCLRALAATALLVSEAEKLTLGGATVWVLHSVVTDGM
jgi:hypothetical protein